MTPPMTQKRVAKMGIDPSHPAMAPKRVARVRSLERRQPPPSPNLSVHGFACWRRRSPNTTPSMTPVARGEATGAQAALPPSHETPDDPEEGGEGEAGAQAAPHPH